ncbi:MAG: glycosyltransferase family 2 protein [Candidatus Xenobiia bacterium LiM19]
MLLSIVIVNTNTRDLLKDCLISVFDSGFTGELEVIVSDNGSTDGSVEMLEQQFPDAVLLKNGQNLGFSAATNRGLKVSKGDYILSLNPDTLLSKGVLDVCVQAMAADPRIGMLGCKVKNPDGSLQPSAFGCFPGLFFQLANFLGLTRRFKKSRLFGRYYLTYQDFDKPLEVAHLLGAFIMTRREALEQVGMLDEDLFIWLDDTDWSLRFSKAGWKILYDPSSWILHYGGQTMKKNPGPSFIEYKRSLFKFYRKHYGRINEFILRAGHVVFYLPLYFLKVLQEKKGSSPEKKISHYYWEIIRMSFTGRL